jgi:CRISPR-associated protein Cmr6
MRSFGGRNVTEQEDLMMPDIPNANELVPMMFRAQIEGRCQVQRIPTNKSIDPDINRWAEEWTEETYPESPAASYDEKVRSKTYQINWRLLSNSGVDDTVIRPVIGARGWPYYPGSSMKGAFRRYCSFDEAERYCGRKLKKGDFAPGSLRFHGGYPIDLSWQENMVDIVHPQQQRQVGLDDKKSSAFAQISLYQPQMCFEISSTIELSEQEWQRIWQIWEQALANGLGSRVSSGYGQVSGIDRQAKPLYSAGVHGQGQASKLIDNTGEFRPNIFRAGIRSHALRIFSGLTDARTAELAVGELFGSVMGKGQVGLLGLQFCQTDGENSTFAKGTRWEQPIYNVEGQIHWHLVGEPNQDTKVALAKLVSGLMQFAMIFGGFGKSWRRADHRLFYEEYYDSGNQKPLIGCHWWWLDDATIQHDRSWHIWKLEQVAKVIEKVRTAASEWLQIRGFSLNPPASWREAWQPTNVQVWGRMAQDAEDCSSMGWIHGDYWQRLSIKGSPLTGKMGEIGRMWQRMYPVVRLLKNEEDPKLPKVSRTRSFLELVVIFPDDTQKTQDFLKFLGDRERSDFQLLWGELNG